MRALLTLALLLVPSSLAFAQADGSVRPLAFAPVSRHGQAGASPFVRHVSGDFVVAADGVLRIGPDGTTRWHHPDTEIVDVASGGDGAAWGLARTAGSRTLRLVRYDDTGTETSRRTLHARQVDAYTYPDITAAPNGDVVVCATIRAGRQTRVVLDRLDASGHTIFRERGASSGECHVVAVDAAGELFWAGEADGVEVLERRDVRGRAIWSTRWDGAPIAQELTFAPDGGLWVAGAFEGTMDLLPGAASQIATGAGYTTFVVRFGPDGTARWAWSGGPTDLAGLLARGDDLMVIEAGTMTRLDAHGVSRAPTRFGFPVRDGIESVPFVSVTGAAFDAAGAVVLVGGLPAPDALGGADFHLFSSSPYAGPRGAVLARPGW